jgi:Zn-dependent metalloprotease
MKLKWHRSSKRSVIDILISLLVLLAMLAQVGISRAFAQDGEPPTDTPEPGTEYQPLALEDTSVAFSEDEQTGAVSYIGASPEHPVHNPYMDNVSALSEGLDYIAAARGFVASYADLFGLLDPEQELNLETETQPDENRTVLRFQQNYQGVPVLGGELILHLDTNGNVITVTGETLPYLSVDTSPSVTTEEAQLTALPFVGSLYGLGNDQLMVTEPELWIYSPTLLGLDDNQVYLVWLMEVISDGDTPLRERVLVDAQTGGILLHYLDTPSAQVVEVYNLNNTTTVPTTPLCTEISGCGSIGSTAYNAWQYASDFYTFFYNRFNRDSIDNAGMPLQTYINSATSTYSWEGNAFWDGAHVLYQYNTGAVADDVTGHEFMHGLVDYTAGLFYYYQSGAIAEAYADIFGEFIDQTNSFGTDTTAVAWRIGEDSGGSVSRYMNTPNTSSQPGRMGDSAYYITSTADNGGVHTNSGVGNHAAYLMAAGDTYNGYTVTGIGIPKTAAIFYEALTNMLTSGADYADLHVALNQSCVNLIGDIPVGAGSAITRYDCTMVSAALNAVQMNQQPTTGFNTSPSLCDGINPTNIAFYNMEDYSALTSNFSLDAGWAYDGDADYYGQNAFSGIHWVEAGTPNNNMDASLTLTSSITLPAGAYLYFNHDYDLQSGSDGGVIEYSTNGGSTWTDAGSMISTSITNNNAYDATITVGPRSAFTGQSHGYIGTRLDLSTLAGQTVMFRWGVLTDGSGTNGRGWWLDDIRVYTCRAPYFVDVTESIRPYAEAMLDAGVTAGCLYTPPNRYYCPDGYVTRTQMAIFLLRAKHGGSWTPPAATGIFADVPLSNSYVNWIEALYNEGITSGCTTSPLNYCPDAPVTRAQMAIFILRAVNGSSYTPPTAAGLFADVTSYANWIEQLFNTGITAGCTLSPFNYCPNNSITRAQMAIFLTRAFDLTIP